MKKPPSLFNRLQWKLTFSYTAITVIVLLLALLIILLLALTALTNSTATGGALAGVLRQSASLLTVPLSQDPPDAAAVRRWIDQTDSGQKLPLPNGSTTNLNATGLNSVLLAVLDRSGVVIASTSPSAPPAASYHDFLSPEEAGIVQNALKGVINVERLSLRPTPNSILVATAVQDQDGLPAGVLIMQMTLPDTAALLGAAFTALLPIMLVFIAAAAVIGLLFGMLTARGLVRRLHEQMRAADAWGRGEFSRQIVDRSSDEIGQLGRAMNHMAADLQELVQTRQDLAAVEERNRLARDLHDSVKQQVFAVSMNLGAVEALWDQDPEKARAALQSASQLSHQAQTELGVLIQTLRPPQLAEKGLPAALNEYVQSWQRLTTISAILRIDCSQPLTPACEEAVYRVVQEALANVARHSAASAVSLELICSPGRLTLKINDNGHGFDPERIARGLGLHSMRERIQTVGGSFEITSGPQGTLLLAEIPLNPSRPAAENGGTL